MSSVTVEVAIPALLEHQRPIAQHPARFKVVRKGRRWGKDRLAFNVSWFGHGPQYSHQGIVDGWDIAWLAPDYPQARIIWQEEIEPRFRGVPGVELNETEHSVTLPGTGALHLRSSENMTSIRGLGKRLIGVVVNEAAHLDLAYAWRQVIRPALADNRGWAMLMSTTNSGTDGGYDEQGNKRVPSYFNTICEEIRAGQRTDEWAEFEGTAEENPKIAKAEFAALVAEYPQDSIALQEEIYAKLLTPGAGLAFPEWRDDLHVLERFDVPAHWKYGAGFDWGYWEPSVFVLCGLGEENQVVVTQERKWVQKGGFEIGTDIVDLCLNAKIRPEWIAADASMWGVPASRGFPNQAEEIQSGIVKRWMDRQGQGPPPVLFGVPKGKDSRIARAQLLHKYLKWHAAEDGTISRNGQPRLRFLKSCGYCVSSIPRLPPDPTKPEDVDTKCFRGTETFLTPSGPRTFAEAEGTSGLAWTRHGWRRYRWCRKQVCSSEVVVVRFDDETEVVCTPDHHFLTTDGQWTPAKNLTGHHVSVASSMPVRSGGHDKATGRIDAGRTFTGWSGQKSTALSHLDTRSITATVTASTIGAPTSNWLPRQNTDAYSHATSTPWLPAPRPVFVMCPSPALTAARTTWPSASTATVASTALANVGKQQGIMPARFQPSAGYAGRRSCEAPRHGPVRPAGTAAAGRYVVSVRPLSKTELTYCINVPDVGEFVLANGLVVANSDDHGYDALTYLLLSRPPLVGVPTVGHPDEDTHPGFDWQRRERKKPWEEALHPQAAEKLSWRPSKDEREATEW